LAENDDNVPNAGIEGSLIMKTHTSQSTNQSVQQSQKMSAAQCLKKNREASEAYVKKAYPGENFLSQTVQLQAANKWTRKLTIPENVRLAESRIPKVKEQSNVLKKELKQAGILSSMGNFVYLTPERGEYKKRVTDAVVNGIPYEFRNITGKSRQVEQDFSDAKTKDKNAHVFLNIESNISKHEVRRRIGLVLKRHADYTGKIVVSFQGKKTYFWDSGSFR
jgi:hypothetical protein